MLIDRGGANPDGPPEDRLAATAVGNLDRLLSSPAFVSAPQLCRFLRFIVEQAASGQGDQLKEYLLGVEVFRRDASFDPRIDNVVRTEARRLRHKLAEYYQNQGKADAIVIELPKGSYCPVFRRQSNEPSSAIALPPTARSRRTFAAIAVLLVVAVALFSWMWMRGYRVVPSNSRPSIAVLPLENLSNDPEQEYFSDGMTDALITVLTRIGGLRVISRTSVLQYKRARRPIPEIARQLGVEYVVEGTIMRSGDRVRITAQLIAATRERHLWAEMYERSGSDVFTVQAEIARAIAGQVNVHLTPQEQAHLSPRPLSVEAHDLYLKGRYNWHTRQSDRLRSSIEYFNQAIRKEPGYALAYAGLADSYSVLAGRSVGANREDLETRACASAKKAIELDDNIGEAHASLAACADNWNWEENERQYRRAIELSPGYSTAHQWYGMLLTNTGRVEDGLTEVSRAAELDPASPSVNGSLGNSLYLARQYDRAVEQGRHTVETFPGFLPAYSGLGLAYIAKGMYREAIDVLDRAVKLTAGDPPVAALLAHAYARAGDIQPAQRLLDEYRRRQGITPVVLALLYLDTGDKDRAFEWLDRAVEVRSIFSNEIKVEPMYDSLHGDPRFTALLRKMNLTR